MSKVVSRKLICRQASDNFLQNRVGSRFNLYFRLVLNRMGDINGIKVSASECRCLSACGGHKFSRSHRHSRNAESFESG